ncbi:hypothetical protein TSUD_155040 [Trifolium subterraneum]|uniref:Uncharacterized protein n=1 Tax=Trifolium subterraneum TaxID=3900 RepID=A0A2Z6MNF6_TRISU|nr:hypothetical protein TSUD_155040 [Trifolium subterraneum]
MVVYGRGSSLPPFLAQISTILSMMVLLGLFPQNNASWSAGQRIRRSKGVIGVLWWLGDSTH